MKVELYGRQYDFVTSEERFTAMMGGIGSGKTLAGCVKSILHAKEGTLGLVVAPTFRMLQDATIRTFLDINHDLVRNFNKSDMIITLKNGAEILFRSGDNPEHLRGPNLHWAWIDEGALAHPMTWDIVIGRLRADGTAGPCWVTTTPKGRANWVYEATKQMAVFNVTTLENPYASEEWKQSLLTRYTGQFLRQEIYGEFVSFDGLVYPMFQPGTHIVTRNISEFDDYALAIDEGYTHPAVILLVYIGGDDEYHIAKEFYESGKLQSEIVEQARRWANGDYNIDIVVDAAAAGLIAALRNSSLRVIPRKGKIMDGIRRVQNLLDVRPNGKPRLTVDPSCVKTIAEFETYSWKDNRDEPIKEYDHSMDAIRYLVNKPKIERVATQLRW